MTAKAATDRIVIVTGASSGIGAACCRRMAGPGLRLMAHARGANAAKRAALEAVVGEVEAAGGTAEAAFGDLGDPDTGAAIVAACVSAYGSVDQIVANAGFANAKRLGEVSRTELDAALAAMTGGLFDLATAALPHLRASERGRIVAVSSFVAHTFPGDSLFPATAAAKGGLEALARALARQVAPDGVTVNCVAPGYTEKDTAGHAAIPKSAWEAAAARTPMGRIAKPDDIAALVAFLLSDDAGHITGQTIHVDGGLGLG